jgi:hypothetical protein
MLSGTGRLIVQGDPERPTRAFVYLPIDVARDSQFPAGGNRNVHVELDTATNSIRISFGDPTEA